MRYSFEIPLPINEKEIVLGDLFVDHITDMDVAQKNLNTLTILDAKLDKNFYYCHKYYELLHFLPVYIQDLFRHKSLRIETKKTVTLN
jgi:hypothetical protein